MLEFQIADRVHEPGDDSENEQQGQKRAIAVILC